MSKKLTLAVAGLLAGATLSVGAASPAQAQTCVSPDPVIAYVCRTLDNVPDVNAWIQHYYETAGRVVKTAYCTVWPGDPDCW